MERSRDAGGSHVVVYEVIDVQGCRIRYATGPTETHVEVSRRTCIAALAYYLELLREIGYRDRGQMVSEVMRRTVTWARWRQGYEVGR
jgi:uncharacterized protein YqgV (UPF0045/DUF77 family)